MHVQGLEFDIRDSAESFAFIILNKSEMISAEALRDMTFRFRKKGMLRDIVNIPNNVPKQCRYS